MSQNAGWRAFLRRPLVAKTFRVLLAVLVLASILKSLSGYRHALAGHLLALDLSWILVAVALTLVYRVINAYGWVLVLRSLGQRVPALTGVRLWLVSET